VTATTINVGGIYYPDAAAADSALGAANSNPGDVQAETNAMVAYINAHGGVAHRKVVMVWHTGSTADPAAQTMQNACSTWTQDHKSFIIPAGANPILDQCVDKAGIVGIGENFVEETTPALRQSPSVVVLDGFSIDRSERITVEGLAQQGYFTKGAKVGIVTWDESDYRYAVSAAALPALSRLGITNVAQSYVAVPQSYSDLGATSSSVASAVLQFHSQGIDHVMLFDGPAGINSDGVLVLEWMQQANSQRYYPKYGLNTTSGFSSLASDYPQQELVGSVGVGWFPSSDLSTADYNALPQSANEKTCTKVMSDAGQAPSNPNQEGVEFGICDEFFFLQQAFAGIPGPLNQQDAMAAIDRLGTSFEDLTTIGTNFSASQHDGANLVRNMSFDSSCDCYKYTSGAYNPG
jgi:hypothetical protein